MGTKSRGTDKPYSETEYAEVSRETQAMEAKHVAYLEGRMKSLHGGDPDMTDAHLAKALGIGLAKASRMRERLGLARVRPMTSREIRRRLSRGLPKWDFAHQRPAETVDEWRAKNQAGGGK